MNAYLLRNRRSGRLVRSLDEGNCEVAYHVGNAIKFPTSGEAEYYITDNDCDWRDFDIEQAGR